MAFDIARATKYFLLVDFFKGFGVGMKYFLHPLIFSGGRRRRQSPCPGFTSRSCMALAGSRCI